jgi:hypothetical protein
VQLLADSSHAPVPAAVPGTISSAGAGLTPGGASRMREHSRAGGGRLTPGQLNFDETADQRRHPPRLKTEDRNRVVHLAVDPRSIPRAAAGPNFQGPKIVFGPVSTLPQPLIRQDRPWEAAWLNTNPTTAWDPTAKKVMLWYNMLSQCPDGMYETAGMCPHPGYPAEWRAASNHEQRTVTCLAESTDGLTNWQKPSLGVVAWNGSTDNNIVIDAGNADGNRGVYYDAHESNSSRRFKLFGSLNTSGDATFCSWSARTVSTATSADGIHFHDIRNVSGQMQVTADTANSVVYDAALGKYLAFTRRHCDPKSGPPWCIGDYDAYGIRREVRSVSLAADFGDTGWEFGEEVAHGLTNDELYSLVPWRSPSWRAGLYFAVASYYQSQSAEGRVTCELVMSADFGQNWTRVSPHQQFIQLGKAGSWNSHTCFSANGLIMPKTRTDGDDTDSTGDEVRFYFAGGDGPHSGQQHGPHKDTGRNNFIGLATATEHALAGLTASDSGNEMSIATAPIALDGATDLWLLVGTDGINTTRDLAVAVTIDGTAAAGTALVADGRVVVRWNQPHSPLEALTSAVFRFSMPPGVVFFAFGFARTGLHNSVRQLKTDDSALSWMKWVRVAWWAGNGSPAWLDRDAARQYALDTLHPDIVDWYTGLNMDRGQFFRRRGVAVSTGSGYEYDQDFALQTSSSVDGAFSVHHFGGNGIEQNEDGSSVFQSNWHAHGMEHFAPRWQQVELQGLARRAVLGDTVSQDNLGDQYAFAPHWSDWSCRRFVQWLQQRNVSIIGGTSVADFNATNGVRDHLAQLRGANRSLDQIALDPIIREYERFMMTSQTQHWQQILAAAKTVAKMANRSEPAVYGNLGSGFSTNYSRPGGMVLQQHVDAMWNEDTGSLGGQRNYSASLMLKLAEAAGTKPDGSKTPNWLDRSWTNTKTDCTFGQVNTAEATANDGVMVGCISSLAPADGCWSGFAAHANFVQKQLWLFTDRQRVSEAVIAYSLPTVVWRHFSTISTLFEGGWDSVSAQQTPLGHHLIWLSYAARLLDENHLSYRGQTLGHPDLMRTAPPLETLSDSTKLVLLPGVDAMTEAQMHSLSVWVRAGGHLMLWGEDSGSLDEELRPRQDGWAGLIADAGRGKVTVVHRATVQAALGGTSSNPPDAAAAESLTRLLKEAVGQPLLHTEAPPDVYSTLWKHGGGDSAVSVDLVHYALNKSHVTQPFKLRVAAPSRCTEAWFLSTEAPEGQALPTSRCWQCADGGNIEVNVPSFHVFGVVVFVAEGEQDFRSAAASLRRAANRLAIAGRSEGSDDAVAVAAASRAREVLSEVQGTAHASFSRSSITALQASLAKANRTLYQITASVDTSMSSANASLRASGRTAVRAYKFGLGRCGSCGATKCEAGNVPIGFEEVVYNDPAWNSSDAIQTHGFLGTDVVGHAITTEGDSAGKFPAIPNSEAIFYDCFYFDYFLDNSPKTFRVANLSAGEYVVTVVTGSFTDYEEVSHTAVSVPSDRGAGMLGDRSASGIWDHRAFRARVGANGTLDLKLGSRNLGSLFQSAYNGWGSGMVSWAAQALTLHRAADVHLLTPWAAASLARNDAIGQAALRRWLVAGPFGDRNATGLERSFPPERVAVEGGASFPGGWSAADILAAGAPAAVAWHPAELPLKGSDVGLAIPFDVPAVLSNGSVAVAAAVFSAKEAGVALLRVSTAQQAVVSFNGNILAIKRLAAGTMPRDAEWEVQLQKGENVLMLRLMLHYGSFSTTVDGPNKTAVIKVFESATDFTAGLWRAGGSGPLPGIKTDDADRQHEGSGAGTETVVVTSITGATDDLQADIVSASCLNKTDCTAELQATLDSCARIVKVPALPNGRSWVVRQISVTCDGQTIEFAAAAVLQAKRGEFHKGEAMRLFVIENRTDVTVLGNGAAVFRMWRSDYGDTELYNHSEGRHGIAIFGSKNIVLDGLTVTETGGDGVYISNILGQLGTPNYNVTVTSCNLTGNYRNAISVISVKGLRVEDTILALSKGTPPQGGIDVSSDTYFSILRLPAFRDMLLTSKCCPSV